MLTIEAKTCSECGERLLGRADKRFCSDACRNSYNNKLNSDSTSLMRNINHVLRKNRRILEGFAEAGEGKARVGLKKLSAKGFNFDLFTSIYRTKNGNEYHFCYEYGYLKLEDDFYMVVKKDV